MSGLFTETRRKTYVNVRCDGGQQELGKVRLRNVTLLEMYHTIEMCEVEMGGNFANIPIAYGVVTSRKITTMDWRGSVLLAHYPVIIRPNEWKLRDDGDDDERWEDFLKYFCIIMKEFLRPENLAHTSFYFLPNQFHFGWVIADFHFSHKQA